MDKINPIKICKTLLKACLLISIFFLQSCSNDERLEGLRLPVLTEQKLFETSKKSHKLALGNPKNISSWTHSGGGSSHSLGNIASQKKENLVLIPKLKLAQKDHTLSQLFKIIRFL